GGAWAWGRGAAASSLPPRKRRRGGGTKPNWSKIMEGTWRRKNVTAADGHGHEVRALRASDALATRHVTASDHARRIDALRCHYQHVCGQIGDQRLARSGIVDCGGFFPPPLPGGAGPRKSDFCRCAAV